MLSNLIPSAATARCTSDLHYAQHKKYVKKIYIIYKTTGSKPIVRDLILILAVRQNIKNFSVHLMTVLYVIKCLTQRMWEWHFFSRGKGQDDETNVEEHKLVPTKLSNNGPWNHFRGSHVTDTSLSIRLGPVKQVT